MAFAKSSATPDTTSTVLHGTQSQGIQRLEELRLLVRAKANGEGCQGATPPFHKHDTVRAGHGTTVHTDVSSFHLPGRHQSEFRTWQGNCQLLSSTVVRVCQEPRPNCRHKSWSKQQTAVSKSPIGQYELAELQVHILRIHLGSL